jgi:hypothetical protein
MNRLIFTPLAEADLKLHGAPASEDLTFPVYRQAIVIK